MFWLNTISFDVWKTFRRVHLRQGGGGQLTTSGSGRQFNDIVCCSDFWFYKILRAIIKEVKASVTSSLHNGKV